METPIATFSTLNNSTATTFTLTLVIGLASLVACIWILKKPVIKAYNYKMLVAMLLFFASLISLGTSVFTGLKLKKNTPVQIYADAIATPYGLARYDNIKNAAIIADKRPSLINSNQSVSITKLLLIEEKGGKAHVLSEEDYPIKAILRQLKLAQQGQPIE
jgi:hypothetical protein